MGHRIRGERHLRLWPEEREFQTRDARRDRRALIVAQDEEVLSTTKIMDSVRAVLGVAGYRLLSS